eukprot:2324100-Prymnesium_polylepis.4
MSVALVAASSSVVYCAPKAPRSTRGRMSELPLAANGSDAALNAEGAHKPTCPTMSSTARTAVRKNRSCSRDTTAFVSILSLSGDASCVRRPSFNSRGDGTSLSDLRGASKPLRC